MVPKWLLRAPGLSSRTARDLLLLLADHRNPKTGQCNPRIATLAQELGVTSRAIDKLLAELRRLGLIKITWKQRSSEYKIVPPDQWPQILLRTAVRNRTESCYEPQYGTRNELQYVSEPPLSINEPDQVNYTTEERERHDSTGVMDTSAVDGSGSASAGALFPLFWEAFVRSGIALNGRDREQAKRMFNRYDRPEQERIGNWVIHQLATVWRSPEFTPRPIAALRSKGWTRVAEERTVPRRPSTIELGLQRVFRRLKVQGRLDD